MKKTGLLHGQLSHVISKMAHGDTILIGDAGMPIGEGVEFIDLALTEGMVPFIDVLEMVLSELKIEKAYIDKEINDVSPQMKKEMERLVNGEFVLEEIPHESLKENSKSCKAAIRTGEFTSYSNIILQAGVLF